MATKSTTICCPVCKAAAHKKPAKNEDGGALFLGVFAEGMGIEDDGIRKFECPACDQVFFLPG